MNGAQLFQSFVAMDSALVARGFPPTSPWWLKTIERFFTSGRRQLVLRVGRRGGKSSTLCRVGVVVALAGEHGIPPGDLGVVAFVSTSREEAAKRLRTIEAILRALEVGFRPLRDGQGFELLDRPVGFQVFTASIAGVSGPTVICGIGDEVAKWKDQDTGANPATEVLASLRPTLATQPDARLFLSSSPLGPSDAHAKAFDDGETSFQCIAHGETWIANPTVSETQTHALEPDPRVWAREYAAIPQAAVCAAFDVDAIDRAMEPRVPMWVGEPVLVIDPSSGRSDSWTWGVVRAAREESGGEFYSVAGVDGLEGKFWSQVTGDEIVDRLASAARDVGIRRVIGDQREELMLRSAFQKRGFQYVAATWTNPAKVTAVELVRRWLRDRQIALPQHAKLRAELLAFEEKIAPSGALTFAGRGAHDDYVALLITTAIAVSHGWLPRIAHAAAPQDPTPREVGASLWSASDGFQVRGTSLVRVRARRPGFGGF